MSDNSEFWDNNFNLEESLMEILSNISEKNTNNEDISEEIGMIHHVQFNNDEYSKLNEKCPELLRKYINHQKTLILCYTDDNNNYEKCEEVLNKHIDIIVKLWYKLNG